MIWRGHDSLLVWIITQHGRKRRDMLAYLSDPRWAHIRFVHLRSAREVEEFEQHLLATQPRQWSLRFLPLGRQPSLTPEFL